MKSLTRTSCTIFVGLCTILAANAFGDAFDQYTRRVDLDFALPLAADDATGGALMDNLPDGRRVIVTTRLPTPTDFVGTPEVRLETAVGSGDFRYLGDLPLSNLDPDWFNPGGFLAISQNNTGTVRVAVGNSNASVGVFDAAELVVPTTPPVPGTLAPIAVDWFAGFGEAFVGTGAWLDNRRLAVASGNFGQPSQLNLLDVTSIVATPSAPPLVLNIPGNTGGVAFDDQQNLFVGLGFGDDVGEIRQFAANDWMNRIQNYDEGSFVTRQLSAANLQFDREGTLLIGGGDVFGNSGQVDLLALHDTSNLMRAARTFDPDTLSDANSYSLVYNDNSGVIYAWDNFGSDPRQVYAIAPIPEPATTLLLFVATAGWHYASSRSHRRT